jgi:hypothetical protein
MRAHAGRLLLAAALVLAGAQAAAQPLQPPAGQPRDGVKPAVPKGTATVRGRVIAADREEPLQRATIRVSGGGLPQALETSTNSKGVYHVRELPAGRYTITAARAGYLPLESGQRFPDEPGMPLEVKDGAELNVDFALPRSSVISGRITDETGDVVPGVNVWAMQPRWFRRERRLVPVRSTRTDDTGHYRITGLAPGEYLVMTALNERWTVTDGDERTVFGYAPSYYPATTSAADAQRVPVAVGQEAGAIDISLVPGRTASISGTARAADGTPLAGATIGLGQRFEGPFGSMSWSVGSTKVAPDGSWTLRDVAPGDYTLNVVDAGATGINPTRRTVTVHGADITGVVVGSDEPVAVSGVVVTDTGEPLPAGPNLRVTPDLLAPGRGPTMVLSSDESGTVRPDGSFTFGTALPGPTMLRVMPLPPEWGVRSVTVYGREHADAPFEVHAGQPVAGVQVVLSRTLPTITGSVDDGERAGQGPVLLFPVDSARWHEETTHLVRPDQYGSFRITRLRPGEYLAIALDYVQNWQASDPEFLEGLRRRATKIQVVDGENEPLKLRVQR